MIMSVSSLRSGLCSTLRRFAQIFDRPASTCGERCLKHPNKVEMKACASAENKLNRRHAAEMMPAR